MERRARRLDAGFLAVRLRLWLTPPSVSTIPWVARRAKHPSGRSSRVVKNIPLYRISETAYVSPQPGPRKRGVSRSSRHAGRAAVDAGYIGAGDFAGRATVSETVAHTTGVTRVRPNRVVLAPGACAPSLAVMRAVRPGTCISHPQGDGGNSASLPGESTTYAVPTIRAGKAGMSPAVPFPAVQCSADYSWHGGSWEPAGSRPSLRPLSIEGRDGAKLGRDAPRGCEGVSAINYAS
jgi:hypothetical protein